MDVEVVSGRGRAGIMIIQLRGINRNVIPGDQGIFSLLIVPPATLRFVLLAPDSTAALALIRLLATLTDRSLCVDTITACSVLSMFCALIVMSPPATSGHRLLPVLCGEAANVAQRVGDNLQRAVYSLNDTGRAVGQNADGVQHRLHIGGDDRAVAVDERLNVFNRQVTQCS